MPNQYRGDVYLAQGLASIADAIRARGEEQKRVLQNGKIADAIIKANPAMLEQLGMSAEAFQSMSAGDKATAIRGAITASTIQEAQMRQQALARQAANVQALPDLFSNFAQTGQPPEAIPAPLSNAEFDRRTQTDPLTRFADALQQSGFQPDAGESATLLRAIMSTQPQAGPGLDLGRTMEIPGLGTLVGTGTPFEPNFVPSRRGGDQPARQYPWLFTDDPDQLRTELEKLGDLDPAERDRVIKTRSAYMNMLGREDPLLDLLKEMLGTQRGDKDDEAKPESKRRLGGATGVAEDYKRWKERRAQ